MAKNSGSSSKETILLIEPEFPTVSKSRNHNDFFPLGLLKIMKYEKAQGNNVALVSGNQIAEDINFVNCKNNEIKRRKPTKIFITSIFTYWAKYVRDSVKWYRELYKNVPIVVGGVYATLMPEDCKRYTECDEVNTSFYKEAEKYDVDWKYLEKYYGDYNYQILFTSRGCPNNCPYCGVNRISPNFRPRRSIKDLIRKKKVVFYDNNLLANPYIKAILNELRDLKKQGVIKRCDAQCGIDWHYILKQPELAPKLKKAGFKDIKISWDRSVRDSTKIENAINILEEAGFTRDTDIMIFMIYNWEIPFEAMEEKRKKCWEWGVQICDCRFRPLHLNYDGYNPGKWQNGQQPGEYYIHEDAGWTDEKVRLFRKHIRRQNICNRLRFSFYSNSIERKKIPKSYIAEIVKMAREQSANGLVDLLDRIKIPYWFPDDGIHPEHDELRRMIYQEYKDDTGLAARSSRTETEGFKKWRLNKIRKNL